MKLVQKDKGLKKQWQLEPEPLYYYFVIKLWSAKLDILKEDEKQVKLLLNCTETEHFAALYTNLPQSLTYSSSQKGKSFTRDSTKLPETERKSYSMHFCWICKDKRTGYFQWLCPIHCFHIQQYKTDIVSFIPAL